MKSARFQTLGTNKKVIIVHPQTRYWSPVERTLKLFLTFFLKEKIQTRKTGRPFVPVGGSRFWFWVPFRQNGIKNGINLNCDWTILFHFLFHAVSRPKRKRINNYIGIFYSKGHTSTFGCKKENVWCTYRKFAKLLENNMFESSNIEQRNMEGGKVNRNR